MRYEGNEDNFRASATSSNTSKLSGLETTNGFICDSVKTESEISLDTTDAITGKTKANATARIKELRCFMTYKITTKPLIFHPIITKYRTARRDRQNIMIQIDKNYMT